MDTGAQGSPSLSHRCETGKEAGWGPRLPPSPAHPWALAPGSSWMPRTLGRPEGHLLPPPPRGSLPAQVLRAQAPAAGGSTSFAGLHPRPPGADLPGVGALAFQEPSLGDLLQAAGGPRSPAVFGAVVSYMEQFFETVGISLAERQVCPSLFSP